MRQDEASEIHETAAKLRSFGVQSLRALLSLHSLPCLHRVDGEVKVTRKSENVIIGIIVFCL